MQTQRGRWRDGQRDRQTKTAGKKTGLTGRGDTAAFSEKCTRKWKEKAEAEEGGGRAGSFWLKGLNPGAICWGHARGRGRTVGMELWAWAGTQGQLPDPNLPHPCQGPHRWVLAAIDWTMALLSMSRSRALEAQPATAGGRLLEKR